MVKHNGFDISHYQNDRGAINFKKAKDAGYEFVVVKATQGSESGSHILDKYFYKNIEQANKAGLQTSAYHYFLAISEDDARAEADWFIKALDKVKLTGYVFCDVEDHSLTKDTDKLTSYINAFLDQLNKAGYNKVGIYSGKSFYENRINKDELPKDCLLWLARYNSFLGCEADMWQYSSSASVPGLKGSIDVNYSYTDKIGLSGIENYKPVKQPVVKKVSHTVKKINKKAPKAVKLIKNGDRGSSVKKLQQNLNKVGFKLSTDGIFGNATEHAVRNFQERYDLSVDGLVGKQTQAKLSSVIKAKSKAKTVGKAIIPFPGHNFEIGSKGKDVKRIQNAVGVAVDGVFGVNTRRAVVKYQKRHGLQADGIVGKNTWNTLF